MRMRHVCASVLGLVASAVAAPAFAQTAPQAPPTDAPTPPTPASETPLVPPTDPSTPPKSQAPAQPVHGDQAADSHRAYIELTSLRVMRDKGVITAAEYDAAAREIGASIGERAGDAATVVLGKWSTTFYGFIKADYIYDSTQSFADVAGNSLVERPNGALPPPPFPPINYRGENGRTTFSVRNSRFGFMLRAPETSGVRASAQLEADFLGFVPPIGPTVPLPQETRLPYETTESVTFTQPVLRLRHANLKLETPIVDILFGQYWHLFGWQNVYQPGMVQAQGGPGHLYGRAPQLRVSRAFRGKDASLELAVAAVRPPARDSAMPDFQAGIRFALNGWTGVHTGGATATSIMPASIAVTGDLRQLRVPEFAALPKDSVSLTTQSLAVNAYVPVIPAKVRKGNSLSLHGEFVLGAGISDLYTNMTGGVQMPTVANNTGLNPPPQYPQNVDNGLAVFDLAGDLYAVRWTTFLIGLQYTLPVLDGRIWLAANYSRQVSPNISGFTRPYASTLPDPQQAYYPSAAQVRKSMDFFDVSAFFEVVPAVRIGVEYARYSDKYVDGVRATNDRVQTAGIFIF